MLQRILCCWLLFICSIQAAFEVQNNAAAIIAGGGQVSIAPEGSNPAALVNNRGFAGSLNYSNLYGIKNLRLWNCNFFYTTRRQSGYALRLHALGNPIYQEKTLSLACGRLILPLIALGISVNYYDLTIADYRHTSALGFNCGAKFFADTVLSFGLYFENVNAPKICAGQESLPQVFAFGWRWQPIRRGELSGELYKDTQRPFTFRSGVRIEIIRGYYLLAGIQLNPDRLAGGLEINWRKIRIALAVQHHPTLPYTFYYGCGINL